MNILVIDDEPDVVCYLSVVFEDQGYNVFTASSGEEGLVLAQKHKPDLITLDITMPGMSGIEVFTFLRRDEVLSKIAVFIVTGMTKIKELFDSRDLRPPEDIFSKPVDITRLLQKIEELLVE